MRRPPEPDPALVERIRGLLAGPDAPNTPGRVGWERGWVPARPGERLAGEPPAGERLAGGPAGERLAGERLAGERLAGERPVPSAEGHPPPRVVTMPRFLRSARVRVGRRALAAVIVLVAGAAAVFALRVSLAVRQGEPVAVAAVGSGLVSRSVPPGFTAVAGPASGSGLATSTQTPSGASAGGGGPPMVLVHVVGEVASPGVVTVSAGSRVADAVAKAGGALPSADLERVNLARVVVDGEQVHLPAPGEPLLPGSGGVAGASGPAADAGSAGAAGAPVNLNTADVAALDTLPGVGPVLAQRIVQWRQEHGRFSSVDELNEVSGIGDKLFAQLRTRVTV